MTECPGCGRECSAAELTRHEDAGFVRVHCPNCGRLRGTYNSHSHRSPGSRAR